MTADVLLSRLENVRTTGHSKGVAQCPICKGRRPKLSYKVNDEGVVLLYCFGGCSTPDILADLGLNLADLYPPRLPDIHHARPRVSPLTPLIAAFENDLLVVHVLLADIGQGKRIDAADRMTAKAAAGRIWAALREARHVV